MNTNVDLYFIEGCRRCPLGGTPQCKVHNWTEELKLLRKIILDCGLTEESKWGVPCYTFRKNNVLVLAAFNDYCSVSFFKGALLSDTYKMLSKPGENTQAARLIKFTNTSEIAKSKDILKAYIFEAIELEKLGLKVEFEKNPDPIPEELQQKLDENKSLKEAFEGLTPGRQRGYILYFSAPKQSKTRESRIDKSIPKILAGKGIHDR
ncbi:YdeI/OmpD-associated family protein [Algoriphagus chordae]|uniref:Uncharacterized protein YdeI (YjbR/CyaY-like superfamily) n=1 Tax=Algoriphagus chordae TaxID=237019 RepID=A0A2W7QIT8_9BACT|nr:YdeI/OmpD-associated family protein [Algoriphagus chordae]PZX48404.1 uncharacterized protein YdeI (YjbR/CyaY-like superfamily) [Algoriphagus chordae]